MGVRGQVGRGPRDRPLAAGRLRLLSRNDNDITAAYPELRALNSALGSHKAILDGEIVAFDEEGGRASSALQPRMHLRGEAAVRRLAQAAPVTYMVFDLLWLDGHSLMELPYTERRARLEALALDAERWRVPDSFSGQGSALLAATREQGLEGVDRQAAGFALRPGPRSGAWMKIKNSERQEVVIGGWTTGKGARAGSIGALLLGVHDETGRCATPGGVGTGFDARELERLAGCSSRWRARTRRSPGASRRRARTSSSRSWSARCEFSEWTHAGTLRQPSYKGLRDDKRAERGGARARSRAGPAGRRRASAPVDQPNIDGGGVDVGRCSPAAARCATASRSRSTAGS